ncbi:STAS domain-containing protein [Novosphingobium beihaiensis]|uniref:Anti-sigma factor antagonist n=1 Tax=Novosphingobium beihaiensis TaxID=2930389 RepID=A0ABT0BTB6_9SPHN|nr:STAS domain-containing protein [Novosphingobium beihaiensis]MCJ2188118.1 STAS domain-containing protein [Novosphingobium beihaiensis]
MSENTGILEIAVDHPRLDAAAAPAFRQELQDRFDHRPERVVLDLTHVDFIDSTGLGVLVSMLKQMGTNGRIAIVGASPAVQRLLQITRLDTLFLQCDSTAAAHDALA